MLELCDRILNISNKASKEGRAKIAKNILGVVENVIKIANSPQTNESTSFEENEVS